jgi:hypothetical protein
MPTIFTHDELVQMLDYNPENGIFTWKTNRGRIHVKGKIAGHSGGRYIRISIKDRAYSAHRLAWLYIHKEWPKYTIDHINGDKMDNRISNLRDVLIRVNASNKPCHRNGTKTSKYLGVSWDTTQQRWRPRIHFNGKLVYLGAFKNEEDAYNVVCDFKNKNNLV